MQAASLHLIKVLQRSQLCHWGEFWHLNFSAWPHSWQFNQWAFPESCTANENQNKHSSNSSQRKDKITHNSTTKVSFSTKIYVLVSTQERSWWYSQNLCRTLLSGQTLFNIIIIFMWHNFSPTRSVIRLIKSWICMLNTLLRNVILVKVGAL